MSVVKYILSNSFLRNISYLVTIISGLIVTPIIVRSLGNTEYAKWVLINTLLLYFMLFDFGYSSGVARFVSRKYQEWGEGSAQKCIATAFYALCGAMVASLVLVGVCYPLLKSRFFPEISNDLLYATMFLILSYAIMVPLRLFHGVLRSQLKWNAISFITVAKTIVMNIFVVALVLNDYGLLGVIIPNAAFLIAEFLAYYVCARCALDFTLNPKLFKFCILVSISKYSFSLFLYQLSNIVGSRSQAYFIALYINLPQVTVFTIGIQLLKYYDELMRSIFDILTPYFSRHENDSDRNVEDYITISAFCFIVASFGGFMIWAYAPSFLYFWVGPELVPSAQIVNYLVIPYVLFSSQIPGRGLVMGTSNQAFMVTLSVFECVTIISLMFIFVERYGMTGMLFCMFCTMVLFRGILFPSILISKLRIPAMLYLYRVIVIPVVIFLVPQAFVHYFIFPLVDRFSMEIGFVFLLNIIIFGGTFVVMVSRKI